MGVLGLFKTHSNKSVVSTPLQPNQQQLDTFYEFIGGNATYTTYKSNKQLAKAYLECAILQAIIGRKIAATLNGKIELLDGKGDYVKQRSPNYNYLNLINNPNPLQSGSELLAQIETHKHIFGYAIGYKVQPYGVDKVEKTKIWCLPPDQVTIKWNDSPYFLTNNKNRISKIEFSNGVKTIQLKKEDCYIFTYPDAYVTNTGHVPHSPLCGLEYPIQNIIKAYESLGVIIEHRGAEGILSNAASDSIGAKGLDPKEEARLINMFKRGFGLLKDQSRVKFTTATLNWQSTAMNVKDLMLNEEVQNRSIEICDRLGYPAQLLGISKNSTYNNVETLEKSNYNDIIIPQSEHSIGQWNDFLLGDNKEVRFDINYCDVPCLQADAKAEADAKHSLNKALQIEWLNDQITLNEWRTANERDTIPNGDVYYSEWKQKQTNNGEQEQEANQETD